MDFCVRARDQGASTPWQLRAMVISPLLLGHSGVTQATPLLVVTILSLLVESAVVVLEVGVMRAGSCHRRGCLIGKNEGRKGRGYMMGGNYSIRGGKVIPVVLVMDIALLECSNIIER